MFLQVQKLSTEVSRLTYFVDTYETQIKKIMIMHLIYI